MQALVKKNTNEIFANTRPIEAVKHDQKNDPRPFNRKELNGSGGEVFSKKSSASCSDLLKI